LRASPESPGRRTLTLQAEANGEVHNMSADKRILVVYYSLTGNTERVAQDLAARLDADLERIEDEKNRKGLFGYLGAALDSKRERSARITDIRKYPSEYGLTIVGTPVWVWKVTPAVRAYLRMVRGRLNDVAFFITSGNTDAEKVVPAMEGLAGRKAIAFAGFNERELKTEALYDQKISAFLKELQSRRSFPGSTHHGGAASYA